MKTLVQFTRVWKRGRTVVRTEPCWILSVSYADGPGMKVKKMTTTSDISKAARFSASTAHTIALQFYTTIASLVDEQGVLKVEATAALLKDTLAAHANRRAVQAEYNRMWEDVFPPELQAIIRKAIQS
jgi:hypothetical protein